MLDRIRKLFADDAPVADVTDVDPKLAAAVLLVDAARADEKYGAEEKARVSAILGARFGLADEEVGSLLSLAEEKAENSVNLHRFTSTVKDNWDEDVRIRMIELLWEVAYADGKIHSYEDHLIRRVAGLIYVTDRQRGEARARVAERLGIHD